MRREAASLRWWRRRNRRGQLDVARRTCRYRAVFLEPLVMNGTAQEKTTTELILLKLLSGRRIKILKLSVFYRHGKFCPRRASMAIGSISLKRWHVARADISSEIGGSYVQAKCCENNWSPGN